MLLEKGEFIGASIPEHLFQAPQACRECRQPAKFTVLVTGAWGEYRKVSLCKSHWEQTAKQGNARKPELLKLPTAQKPEPGPSGRKPGKVVPWPTVRLKHAAITLTFFLAGAARAASQTGQLAVTARIESSATYSQGPDGRWILTVANVNDSAAMFAPEVNKVQAQERGKKRTPPAVRQQNTGGRTSGSQKSISKAGCQ